MITSVKVLTISSAASASSRRFSATMPPKAETGSQASALQIGLRQRRALRHAARVGVLDDRDRRGAGRVELADQLEGRVGVVDVVVGELLALQLPGGGDARAASRR